MESPGLGRGWMLFFIAGVSCLLGACIPKLDPPTKDQAMQAIQSFRSDMAGSTNLGMMQDSPCLGTKLGRVEIVEIKEVTEEAEYFAFPGKEKYLATLVEEGSCAMGISSQGFYLERDFLLVSKGLDGMPADESGTWTAWPLEYVYDIALLKDLEKNYEELRSKTGMNGFFLALITTSKMEKNNHGINVFPRNPDHYYMEINKPASGQT